MLIVRNALARGLMLIVNDASGVPPAIATREIETGYTRWRNTVVEEVSVEKARTTDMREHREHDAKPAEPEDKQAATPGKHTHTEGGPPHHKILFRALVKPGVHIRDAHGKPTAHAVTDGDVDIEADTPVLELAPHRTLVYTWGHGKHGGEASGYLELQHDFVDGHHVKKELHRVQGADHQPGDHPPAHAPKAIAQWKATLRPVPPEITIKRPSDRSFEALKTFATGDRLDLCHNVPNQPGGGGVVTNLLDGDTFHQTSGHARVAVFRSGQPAGFSHWIKGYVVVGHAKEVLVGWVLLSVDGEGHQLKRK